MNNLLRNDIGVSFLWRDTVLQLVIATIIIITTAIKLVTKKHKHEHRRYQRRTSHASTMQANRPLLKEVSGMKQNVINVLLSVDGSPTRADLVNMMTTLADKFERMHSIPYVDENGVCTWLPIQDLTGAIDKAVIIDSQYNENGADEQRILQRAHTHIGEMLTAVGEDSIPLPLWRSILLSPTTVLIRIDHCICDGLSAVTLLKDIGVKTSSNTPLSLSDLSPILSAIEKAGDMYIALAPLKLLWPPNLIRAVSLLVSCLSHPNAYPNPLRPLPEHAGKVIPNKYYGTVYFPTMPVALFKDIAKAMGSGTTINDVLLLCWTIAVGQYMDELNQQGLSDYGNVDNLKVLLPIGTPLKPSRYGDYKEGLCNRMCPVIIPCHIPRQRDISFSSTKAIIEIKRFMERIKKSNTPLLMACLNTILMPLLSVENLKEAAKHSFDAVSCVYTNVAGPTESISLKSTTNLYEIKKIQVVMPHPVSILTILSYNGSMFFNITLDTRSGIQAQLLRTSFVEAVKTVADEVLHDDKNWNDELASLSISNEWGGNGVVYTSCSTPAYSKS